MPDCVFCLIRDKKIPSQTVYEDNDVLAFKDINPESPVHIIVIPKKHISTLMDISQDDDLLVSKIYSVIRRLAVELDLAESGFRVVTNYGRDGGQTVNHLHFHLLGGRPMQWPPG